jgi:hypothetical protein
MPIRNGEKYLRAAIDSIVRQSLQDFEFVIVDDGSTDSTPSILEEASRHDPRIRVLPRGSVGIAGALEAGRALARASYIARMDGDDVALPHRLAAQLDYLEAHPAVVAVGGQVRVIDENGTALSRGRFPVEPPACRAYLAFGALFCHPAVMMRRDALQQVGGYRRLFEPAEDIDLWLRLSTVGDLANLDDEILQYRTHSASVTRRRARPNARAACLARLAHTHGETILPSNWYDLHTADAEWSAIEAELPSHLRLAARASYLQALTLNGGITEPKTWSFFVSSIPEIARCSHIGCQTDELAFMIVRAAYQMARSAEPFRALLPLWLGLRHAPIATCQETVASLRARLAADHVSRAGTSVDRLPLDAPAATSKPTKRR